MISLCRDHLEQLRDSKTQVEERYLAGKRDADEQRYMVTAMKEENARLLKHVEEALCEKNVYWERIEELEEEVKGLKTEC
jgi:superfamily II DNA helicase RecQ